MHGEREVNFWQDIPQTGDSIKEKMMGYRIIELRSVVDQFVGMRKS